MASNIPEMRADSFAGALAAGINRNRGDQKIENADVSVEIEGELHVREISRADERLLIHEETGDGRNAEEIHGTETGDEPEQRQAGNGPDVHRARDPQRSRDAEPDRNRLQMLASVDVEILTRIQYVEPPYP